MAYPVAVDDIIAQLTEEQERAGATVDALRELREQVAASAAHLEGPTAVIEHIDYFIDLFIRGGAELGRIAAQLSHAINRGHADGLRQLARRCAAEHQRLVQFRHQWINKPLPHERMRRLLNVISLTTREQLDAFRELTQAATAIEAVLPPRGRLPASAERQAGLETDEREEREEKEERGFNRRALFTRLFRDR